MVLLGSPTPTRCCITAALHAVVAHAGQGLGMPSKSELASSSSGSLALKKAYMQSLQRAQALSARYRQLTNSQKQACAGRNNKASLCGGLAGDDADVMLLATSPQSFSWHGGGSSSSTAPAPSPFGPVGNQEDCWTCVAFAVTAAAEAAVARALNLPSGSVSISEQYLVRPWCSRRLIAACLHRLVSYGSNCCNAITPAPTAACCRASARHKRAASGFASRHGTC